ncbi:MAG: hypothetical protein IPH88_02025 [Bacteroidales bacterium]|nr:hypothetical protein [Bacteroidales bacterium]
MEVAGINELKRSLGTLKSKELVEICSRLARYKKENKELISYLLFYNGDENGFIQAVKNEIHQGFESINSNNAYFFLKGCRKILKVTNKYCRFSGKKETEVDLLMYYLKTLKETAYSFDSSVTLGKFKERQVVKVRKVIANLHEDLQFDYNLELNNIES